ncbi:MAG: 2Fe-2S iron-sulfur cluster-binding protein [Spirochaetia bacterium]
MDGSNEKIPISPAISVLNTLLQNGVRISHLCGGKAVCGTCRIKILAGEEYLSPMQEAERVRLTSGTGKNEPPPHTRLACQTYARGDIKIKILAPGPNKRTNKP